MGLGVPLFESYRNNCFCAQFFKNFSIILFENVQGINPMGLISYLTDYNNKKYLTNMKFSPTTLKQNTQKLQGI